MKKYLICLTHSSSGQFSKIFRVSDKCNEDMVSVPENCVCFFFLKSENDENQIMKYIVKIQIVKGLESILFSDDSETDEIENHRIFFVGKKTKMEGRYG